MHLFSIFELLFIFLTMLCPVNNKTCFKSIYLPVLGKS